MWTCILQPCTTNTSKPHRIIPIIMCFKQFIFIFGVSLQQYRALCGARTNAEGVHGELKQGARYYCKHQSDNYKFIACCKNVAFKDLLNVIYTICHFCPSPMQLSDTSRRSPTISEVRKHAHRQFVHFWRASLPWIVQGGEERLPDQVCITLAGLRQTERRCAVCNNVSYIEYTTYCHIIRPTKLHYSYLIVIV